MQKGQKEIDQTVSLEIDFLSDVLEWALVDKNDYGYMIRLIRVLAECIVSIWAM